MREFYKFVWSSKISLIADGVDTPFLIDVDTHNFLPRAIASIVLAASGLLCCCLPVNNLLLKCCFAAPKRSAVEQEDKEKAFWLEIANSAPETRKTRARLKAIERVCRVNHHHNNKRFTNHYNCCIIKSSA